MGEEKRKSRRVDYQLSGDMGEALSQIVTHVLEGSNDPQVVIGPLVKPPIGQSGPDYFVIASSEPGRGFRCDQISIGDGMGDGKECRSMVLGAFVRFGIGRGLVVHDTDDELYMAKLCEAIWPGERISKLVKIIEAERAVCAGSA
jgi:hypothetical protein